jgi:hypothetical protein
VDRGKYRQAAGVAAESGVKVAKTPSGQFNTCRKLVCDDAFETQLAAEMATPLLSGTLTKINEHYPVGVFLRRSLTRYLALVLSRLLDKPENGRTGVSASIASLLDMAQTEAILDNTQIERFVSDFEKIKNSAAQGAYDLVRALRDLRNIHLAHTLIPWNRPRDDVAGHHLTDFAEAIFNFVMTLDQALADATSISLADLRKSAEDFRSDVDRFYEALKST